MAGVPPRCMSPTPNLTKHPIRLFSGSSHPELAQRVADCMGLSLTNMHVGTFSNGETRVEIKESCRGVDAFIIQPTCSSPNGNSVNDNLMELHIIACALKGSSAHRITAVMPIYGYARQDKKDRSRAAITARVVAKHLESDGIARVITLDLHASQIQGMFDIPVDNLYGETLLVSKMLKLQQEKSTPIVIVSPDAGGAKRAIRIAKKLKVPYAIISKNREEANKVAEMDLTGEVAGKMAFIVDDMADTCGTLTLAAEVLIKQGKAKEVHAFVTHGVLSGPAIDRLNACDSLTSLVVTDSIPQRPDKCSKLVVLNIAPLLADVIQRTHNNQSISVLFD